MARKQVSDLLALALLLIGIWILTFLTNVLTKVGIWSGIIGASILVIVEGYFLIKSWTR